MNDYLAILEDSNMNDNQIIEQAKNILQRRLLARRAGKYTRPFTNPEEAAAAIKDMLWMQVAEAEQELFLCVALDNRHRYLGHEILFQGTIDGASVHPREVVKWALRHNAAALILAHNHPSGVAEASQADISITHRLRDSLSLVDVRVLDHFIIGETVVSMAQRGLM